MVKQKQKVIWSALQSAILVQPTETLLLPSVLRVRVSHEEVVLKIIQNKPGMRQTEIRRQLPEQDRPTESKLMKILRNLEAECKIFLDGKEHKNKYYPCGDWPDKIQEKIRECPNISRDRLYKELDISHNTLNKVVGSLCASGRIRRKHSGKRIVFEFVHKGESDIRRDVIKKIYRIQKNLDLASDLLSPDNSSYEVDYSVLNLVYDNLKHMEETMRLTPEWIKQLNNHQTSMYNVARNTKNMAVRRHKMDRLVHTMGLDEDVLHRTKSYLYGHTDTFLKILEMRNESNFERKILDGSMREEKKAEIEEYEHMLSRLDHNWNELEQLFDAVPKNDRSRTRDPGFRIKGNRDYDAMRSIERHIERISKEGKSLEKLVTLMSKRAGLDETGGKSSADSAIEHMANHFRSVRSAMDSMKDDMDLWRVSITAGDAAAKAISELYKCEKYLAETKTRLDM